MTLRIPLLATPSQRLTITLGKQRCQIEVTQKYTGGVFLTLTVDGVNVANSTLCRDRVAVVRQLSRPLVGKLAFVDTQGTSDPDYTGFGTRFQLVYIP